MSVVGGDRDAFRKVTVLGGGAWGTALAMVAGRAGCAATLWARSPAVVEDIRRNRTNSRHLPGLKLGRDLAATGDLAAATATAEVALLAVPSQAVAEVVAAAAGSARPGMPLVICAKGLDRGTGRRLSEVVRSVAPPFVPAVLSGPSFAVDVARGLPTAVTIAAEDGDLALRLCRTLAGPTFRPYAETDLIGVELGGALKNGLAIAVGIVAGRGLGASAGAALVARGFAELRRFGEAFGARPDTLMGLSGLGDLVLTCAGPQSRNFSYGFALGAGRPPPPDLAEGVVTAGIARDLGRRAGIALPVIEAVAEVLAGSTTIDAAVELLMARPLRHEAD